MKVEKIVVMLSTFVLAHAAQANLLTNPGFETGDFTGWTVGGNVPLGYGVAKGGQRLPDNVDGAAYARAHGGTYTAWASTRGGYGEALVLSQTLELDAGTYSAGFYFQTSEGDYGNSSKIYIDGNYMSYTSSHITSSSKLASFNFSLASGGIHTIEFDISGSGSGPVSISADDFFLNDTTPVTVAVPEPSMLALMVTGLLGLGLLRRSKRS